MPPPMGDNTNSYRHGRGWDTQYSCVTYPFKAHTTIILHNVCLSDCVSLSLSLTQSPNNVKVFQ